MSRRWLIRLSLFLGLFMGGLGLTLAGLGWLALRQLTPENLVRRIEENHNCRADIQGCEVSLWPGPARVVLTGVQLTPRDEAADRGLPPAERPPAKVKETVVAFERGLLEVDLWPLLLQRRLLIRELSVSGGEVKADLLPNGENTLRPLWARPRVVRGQPQIASTEEKPRPAEAEEADANKKKDKDRKKQKEKKEKDRSKDVADKEKQEQKASPVFNARDIKFSSRLRRVAIDDASLHFRVRKSKTVIQLDQCTLALTDISLDPQQLDTENHATLALRTRLVVNSRKREDLRYADIGVRMDGHVRPFDPATGDLAPDLAFTTVFEKGSALQGLPLLEKLQKNFDKARRAGLKLGDLQKRTALDEDARLSLRLHANRFTLLHPATLTFADYSLALEEGSFIDTGTEEHLLSADFTIAADHSQAALRQAEAFLGQLSDEAAAPLRELLIEPLVHEGRLALRFRSSGELDDPKVKIDHPLQDLKDQLEETGKSLLNQLKKNILGDRSSSAKDEGNASRDVK